MNVNIPFLKHYRIDFQFISMRLNKLVCYRGRFLHHIAEVACHIQCSSAPAQADFNRQNLATNRSPSQSDGNARHGVFHFFLIVMHRHAKGFLQIVLSHFLIVIAAYNDCFCLFTNHVSDSAFKVTNTSLTCVIVNDFIYYLLRESHVFCLQAVFFQLFRNQVAFCDLIFFLTQITVQINYFHSVAQGRMDGLNVIRGGDKHHLRKIEI